MIIMGSKDRIDSLPWAAITTANLVVELYKDGAFIRKDRFSTKGQRFVDFPEMADILELHFSEISVDLPLTNQKLSV